MSDNPRYYQLTCAACSETTVVGPELLLKRFREAGILRRQKDPPMEMMEQLLPSSSDRFRCGDCGHVGLSFQQVDDEWDDEDWGQGPACEQCGETIPAERAELFPNAKLCVSCQRADELGQNDDTTYCPHCGAIMTIRLRRGAGIAGYQMYCSDCKR